MISSFGTVLVVAVLGYLFLLAVLALAALIVVRSAKDGRTGGCTGCAIALAIVLAAGLGAVGCTAATLVAAGSDLIKHGPVKSLRIERSGGWNEHDAHERDWRTEPGHRGRYPVRLEIELRGDVDVGRIARWIRDELDGDVAISYEVRETAAGGRRTLLEVGLPIDPDEMADFERELREELPELELPEAIRIEIRSPEDD